jgi:hypothetical protein
MKLTAEEEREIENIRDLMESETTYVPIVYKDWLDFLLRKRQHNECSNTNCEGYEGTEEETVCPKCGSELFKLITV